jgi:hypothetical protein
MATESATVGDRTRGRWPTLTGREVFRHLADVVFFLKDLQGATRLSTGRWLARGLRSNADLLGRTAVRSSGTAGAAYKPRTLGASARDPRSHERTDDKIRGFCSPPLPLPTGRKGGLAFSRDSPARRGPRGPSRLACAVDQTHFARPPGRTWPVGRTPGRSFPAGPPRLHLTPRRALVRIASFDARRSLLLDSATSLAQVAPGLRLHRPREAFSRQFKVTAGLTPRPFRERHSSSPASRVGATAQRSSARPGASASRSRSSAGNCGPRERSISRRPRESPGVWRPA